MRISRCFRAFGDWQDFKKMKEAGVQEEGERSRAATAPF